VYASAGWAACVNIVAIGAASIICWIASRRFAAWLFVDDQDKTVVQQVKSKESSEMYKKKELIFRAIVVITAPAPHLPALYIIPAAAAVPGTPVYVRRQITYWMQISSIAHLEDTG
jgi:hypothetical protein